MKQYPDARPEESRERVRLLADSITDPAELSKFRAGDMHSKVGELVRHVIRLTSPCTASISECEVAVHALHIVLDHEPKAVVGSVLYLHRERPNLLPPELIRSARFALR